jgi:hypothetical protein
MNGEQGRHRTRAAEKKQRLHAENVLVITLDDAATAPSSGGGEHRGSSAGTCCI